MKELSIEEKAKAYDEAIKKLRSLHNNYDTVSTLIDVKEELENIFPELKERKEIEDDKIVKHLITLFKNDYGKNSNARFAGIKVKDIIAWLEKQGEPTDIPADAVLDSNKDGLIADTIRCKIEKQGEQKPINIVTILDDYFANTPKEQQDKDWEELKHLNNFGWELVEQKPAEWSEEDQSNFNELSSFIFETYRAEDASSLITWFKSLKDRVQPKQEWSEEEIENCAREAEDNNCIILAKHIRQLKSLRPQSTWKPSEEQMDALEYYMHTLTCNEHKEVLFGLMKQLKKLREE